MEVFPLDGQKSHVRVQHDGILIERDHIQDPREISLIPVIQNDLMRHSRILFHKAPPACKSAASDRARRKNAPAYILFYIYDGNKNLCPQAAISGMPFSRGIKKTSQTYRREVPY